MKYVVTGGAGFIGSHLIKKLEQEGHDVFSIDRDIHEKHALDKNYIWADICDQGHYNKLLDVMRGADAFFHLAGKKHIPSSVTHVINYNRINLDGSLCMLELCREAGVKRFIFASTCAVYGEHGTTGYYNEGSATKPLSPYGLQKLTVEKYCKLYSRLHGLDTVSLRYFNVFGSGSLGSVIDIFLKQHKENKPLTIFGEGDCIRDYVFVDDIVNANIAAARHPEDFGGDVFNVGSGKGRSVNELAIAIIGEDKMNGVLRKPLSVSEVHINCADISKIKKHLNWAPKIDVIDWLSNQ